MSVVLEQFPGAQRALFRRYHIGGCSSCGFQPTETLAEVCARNGNLDVAEVLAHIQSSHEQDAKVLISPKELAELLQKRQIGEAGGRAFARGIRGGEHRWFRFAVAAGDAAN